MALWSRLTAPTLADFLDALNGAQVGIVDLTNGADVDGQTFVIDTTGTPRTVTFVPAKSVPWTIDEIVDAINTAHVDLAGVAHVKVSPPGMPPKKWLSIWKDGGATVKTSGTANPELGFSASADQVGAVEDAANVQRLDRDADSNWTAIIYK